MYHVIVLSITVNGLVKESARSLFVNLFQSIRSISSSIGTVIQLVNQILDHSFNNFLWTKDVKRSLKSMFSVLKSTFEPWLWLQNNLTTVPSTCTIGLKNKLCYLRSCLVHCANQLWGKKNRLHVWGQLIRAELGLIKNLVYLVHPRAGLQNMKCYYTKAWRLGPLHPFWHLTWKSTIKICQCPATC